MKVSRLIGVSLWDWWSLCTAQSTCQGEGTIHRATSLKLKHSLAGWDRACLLIPAPRSHREINLFKFNLSLLYSASSQPLRATQWEPVLKKSISFILIYLFVYGWTLLCHTLCGDLKATCNSIFAFSNLWVLGINLRSSGLVGSCFTEPFHPLGFFYPGCLVWNTGEKQKQNMDLGLSSVLV